MEDIELQEDRDLQPYQGELFSKQEKVSNKKIPNYKTRGDIRGRSSSPFDSMTKPNWMKEPTGEIKIVYE